MPPHRVFAASDRQLDRDAAPLPAARTPLAAVALAVAFALALSLTFAASAAAEEEESAEAPPADEWHTVEAGPFSVGVELEGVVESPQSWPIRIEFEAYRPNALRLVENVEQGARVAPGDTLLKFDPEPLEQTIEDREADLAVTDATIDQMREDLRLNEEGYELELASRRRSLERTEADYERWREIQLPLEKKDAEMSLATARQRLDNAREELTQLQRMYRDEDLTEESEEIVLRRQQHAVKIAEFNLERAEHSYERTLGVDLPRREEDMQQRLKRDRAGLERVTEHTPRELAQSRRSLEKRLHDRQNAVRELEQLRGDLDRLTLTAPAEGVVHYGSVTRGRWSGAEEVAQSMRPDGMFQPGAVVLTVVDPSELRVRAAVPENLYYRVEQGLTGHVVPRAFPATALGAEVETLRHVSGSEFDVLLTIDHDAAPARLRPGMNVAVHLTAYEAEEAVSVPAAAVRRAADGSAYVKRRTDGNPAERRPVTLGVAGDDAIEITEGLEPGDQIKLR